MSATVERTCADESRLPSCSRALAGSVLGGLTSLASAWLTQHHQDRATRLSQDKARRQKLYKQFIDEASKLYADALAHDKAEISALVSVYALISRMRVVSSSAVVEKAEAVILNDPSRRISAEQDVSQSSRTHQSQRWIAAPFRRQCREEQGESRAASSQSTAVTVRKPRFSRQLQVPHLRIPCIELRGAR